LKKILVIQSAFIGDAILATALLESLHTSIPESQIDLLVRKGNEGLFDCHPYLRKLWVWNKRKAKYYGLFRLIRAIRKEHYDLVINLQRFFATGLICFLSGAKETRGFRKNPFSFSYNRSFPHHIGDGTHETERNHSLLQGLCSTAAAKPKLYLQEEHRNRVEEYLHTPFITFAPASVWFTKQFPEHKWIEALESVPEDIRIIALGSAMDRDRAQRILDSLPGESALNLCGDLNLLESAALMKEARLNLVNDSAPLHLASAVDAPVVAIFCSTIPAFGFGPLSGTQYIVEVQDKLDCRPCGIHGFKECPKGHFRCANDISKNQFDHIFNEL
jgi:lipopolysaccharide heptosyltransferase II